MTRVVLLVAMLVSLLAPAPAVGQMERTENSVHVARALSDAFARAAERIERSVVHITTKAEIQRVRRDVFGRTYKLGEPELRQSGLGSGVIVDESGLILTNHHVIANGDRLMVRLHDDREIEAELVGSDEATDLAVLRIDAPDLVAAPLGDSDALGVGEWVLAVGSPFGFDFTVTAGIVSAKGRTLSDPRTQQGFYQEFIQTDAAVNPGNSGGPLINLEGEVVGINSAIISQIRQSAGLSFAIPSAVAEGVMRSLVETGRVERGYLGIGMAELEPEARIELGLRPDEGIVVTLVEEGGPADRADIRVDDIIVEFNGRAVIGGQSRLRNLIALSPPGSEVTIKVLRDGEPRSLAAVLIDRSEALAQQIGGRWVEDLGAAVRPMTREMSRELGYRRFVPGVLVIGVEPGTPADEAGIEAGDILTEVDGRRIGEVGELEDRLRGVRGTVQIELVRGRIRAYAEVELD